MIGDIVVQFDFGYVLMGWDNLLFTVGNEEKFDLMVKVGLISKCEFGGHYDWFRVWVIFFIYDSKGCVIVFGGRLMDEGESKYLNLFEILVFHKGLEFYNLYCVRFVIVQ